MTLLFSKKSLIRIVFILDVTNFSYWYYEVKMKNLLLVLSSFLVCSFCYFFSFSKKNDNLSQSIFTSELSVSNSTKEIEVFKDTIEIKKTNRLKIMKDSIEILKMELHFLHKKKPIKPQKIKIGENKQFEIDFNVVEFPTLAGYDNILFENKDNTAPMADSIFTISWDSLSLIRNEETNSLMMHLIESDRSYFFNVLPCFKEGSLFDKALNIFMKKRSKFQKKVKRLLKQKGDIEYRYAKLLKKWNLEIEKIKKK
jgi:hypothetical protein